MWSKYGRKVILHALPQHSFPYFLILRLKTVSQFPFFSPRNDVPYAPSALLQACLLSIELGSLGNVNEYDTSKYETERQRPNLTALYINSSKLEHIANGSK